MSTAQAIGNTFDEITPLLLQLFDSQYLNFGYWDPSEISFAEAQLNLVQKFGDFSQLNNYSKIVDVGFGTGEQDLYFIDKYQCKQITGINVSKKQVEAANQKIKNIKKYSDHIKFQIGDAMKINEVSGGTYNRVLALESVQLFTDKLSFFNGAFHLLNVGGYLSLASPILNDERALDINHFSDVMNQIPKDNEMNSLYGERFKARLDFFLNFEKKTAQKYKNYSPYYEEYIKYINESKFRILKIENISSYVNKFYFPTKEKIISLLKTYPPSAPQCELLLDILVIFYMRAYTFENKSAGYYLILAEK